MKTQTKLVKVLKGKIAGILKLVKLGVKKYIIKLVDLEQSLEVALFEQFRVLKSCSSWVETPGTTSRQSRTPDTYGGKPSCSTGSPTHWLPKTALFAKPIRVQVKTGSQKMGHEIRGANVFIDGVPINKVLKPLSEIIETVGVKGRQGKWFICEYEIPFGSLVQFFAHASGQKEIEFPNEDGFTIAKSEFMTLHPWGMISIVTIVAMILFTISSFVILLS